MKILYVSNLGYCKTFKNKKDKDKEINENWPDIIFYFEGHEYVWTPYQYSYDYGNNKIGACLGFEGESASKITLGATFMQDHDVIFDRQNQKIGFAVADCNRGSIENNNKKLKDFIDDDKKKDNLKNDKIDLTKILIISLLVILVILLFLLIFLLFYLLFKKHSKRRNHSPQIDEITNS